ncbi:hypothetical protein [Salinibacter altiplanensis]|uniref:hypothetical protein n=1 Tax=Salinibacter altiplanensis TaxID=1803181 RepID=UPI000C9EDBD5|nr:hypothetical protein [Salinibacter altiplanensis]
MNSLQIRARAEQERRRRQSSKIIFYDPDDPEEPEKSFQAANTSGEGVPFLCPEKADEEDLRAGEC